MTAVEQLSLPVPRPRPSVDRVWVLASTQGEPLSTRHSYHFVDPDQGMGILSDTDCLIVRQRSGSLIAYAPRRHASDKPNVVEFRDFVYSLLSSANQPHVQRGAVRDVVAISSRPGPALKRDAAGQRRRDQVRSNVEEIFVRLAMEPRGKGEPRTLQALCSKLGPKSHPVLEAILRREQADTLAHSCRSDSAATLEPALQAYRRAVYGFTATGSAHQIYATKRNARSLASLVQGELLPKQTAATTPGPSIGFSMVRMCGLSLASAKAPAKAAACSAPLSFASLGEIDVEERLIRETLAGWRSPHRRLAASVRIQGKSVTLLVGVVDELRGLLQVAPFDAKQDDVESIRVSCDTIAFMGAPYAFYPQTKVTFSGESARGCRHEVTVRATLSHDAALELVFVIHTHENACRFFI